MTAAPWIIVHHTLTLYCHVQPGARKNRLCGVHNQRLKIQLRAPPVDGKANIELVAYLANKLAQPKKNFTISSGQTHRFKTIEVTDVEEVPQLLTKLLED